MFSGVNTGMDVSCVRFPFNLCINIKQPHMSILSAVNGNPAALAAAVPFGSFGYTNNTVASLASTAAYGAAGAQILAATNPYQQMLNVPLTPVAASAGSLLNNTYQVQQTAPSVVAPNGFFSAYASSLGSGGPFVKGVQAYDAVSGYAPPPFEAASAAILADTGLAEDTEDDEIDDDHDPARYTASLVAGSELARAGTSPAPAPTPAQARTQQVQAARTQQVQAATQQVQALPPRLPTPVFSSFPQSVPLTAVGTAMLQNAAAVTGSIRNGDAAYALNVTSLWGGANIRPLFYATPVGFGMTRTCDCGSRGNCPAPCNFGQAWRF